MSWNTSTPRGSDADVMACAPPPCAARTAAGRGQRRRRIPRDAQYLWEVNVYVPETGR